MKMIKLDTQSQLSGNFEGVFAKFIFLWLVGPTLQSMYVGGKRTTFRNHGFFFLNSGYKSEIIRFVSEHIHLPSSHFVGPTNGLIQVIDFVTFISLKLLALNYIYFI